MSRHDGRLHPVDVAVLGHLDEAGVDYPTCIAHRQGIPPSLVKRRCETLAERDLIEPISHEVVYRITEAGVRRLAASESASERSTAGDRQARTPGRR